MKIIVNESNYIITIGITQEYFRDSRRNLGKKEWKPPIIGKLSDDFLRVPNEISNSKSIGCNCHIIFSYVDSASIGFVCKSCSKLKLKNVKNELNSSQVGSSHSPLTASEVVCLSYFMIVINFFTILTFNYELLINN